MRQVVFATRGAGGPGLRDAGLGAADRLFAGALSGAIGLLHVSAAVAHWRESHLYGALFVLLAVAQLGWGAAVAFGHPGRLLSFAGPALCLGAIAVYVCSRTLGLPFGPDVAGPETVGVPDLMATVDELAVIATAIPLYVRGQALPDRAVGGLCLLTVASLLVFVCFGHLS